MCVCVCVCMPHIHTYTHTHTHTNTHARRKIARKQKHISVLQKRNNAGIGPSPLEFPISVFNCLQTHCVDTNTHAHTHTHTVQISYANRCVPPLPLQTVIHFTVECKCSDVHKPAKLPNHQHLSDLKSHTATSTTAAILKSGKSCLHMFKRIVVLQQ